MAKGYKRLSQEEYSKIKSLTEMDIADVAVAKIMGRSNSLVGMIRKSRSFAEYHEIVRSTLARTAANRIQNKTGKAQGKGVELQESLKEVVEAAERVINPEDITTEEQGYHESPRLLSALHRIGDQLERLADAWEKEPAKKKFF